MLAAMLILADSTTAVGLLMTCAIVIGFADSGHADMLSSNLDALVVLREMGDPSGALQSWTGSSPCTSAWTGVTCTPDGSQVSKLSVRNSKLTGPLPPQLTNLTSLSYLDLSGNQLEGLIPQDLGSLPSLTHLDLSNNKLTGSIPRALNSIGYIALTANYLIGKVPQGFDSRPIDLNCIGFRPGRHFVFGQRHPQVCSQFYPDLFACKSCQPPLITGTNGSCYCVHPVEAQIQFSVDSEASLGNFTANARGVLRHLAALMTLELQQLIPISFTAQQNTVDFDVSILPILDTQLSPEEMTSIEQALHVAKKKLFVPFFHRGFSLLSFGPASVPTPIAQNGSGGSQPLTPGTVVREKGRRSPVPAVIGAIMVLVLGGGLVAAYLVWRQRVSQHYKRELSHNINVMSFPLDEVQASTDNFSNDSIIGKGGSGTVYKATLRGLPVAVKRRTVNDKRGHDEFVREVRTHGSVYNKYLVNLQGYCMEAGECLLVYDLMSNGNLEDALFGKGEGQKHLSWPACVRILLECAKALAFLHDGCNPKIVHCDLNPANILLDSEFEAHISNFGQSRPAAITSMQAARTTMNATGYIAPECATGENFGTKSDVYSFGVVMLVVISRRQPYDATFLDGGIGLVHTAKTCAKLNRHQDIIFKGFLGAGNDAQVERLFLIALLCVQTARQKRPTMKTVIDLMSSTASIPNIDLETAPLPTPSWRADSHRWSPVHATTKKALKSGQRSSKKDIPLFTLDNVDADDDSV